MLTTTFGAWGRRAWPAQRWDRATAVLLLLLATLAVVTLRDYGPTFDEGFQRDLGQAVVAWYRTAFQDHAALEPGSTGNQHYYGGLFDGLAELVVLVLPLDPFDARHLFNAVWALAGLLGTGLLARRLAGPRAGFLAVALLAASGAWWGHAFANSKDIPFAAPYPWCLLTLLSAADDLPRLAPRRIGAAGLALGAALGVRPAGVLLLVPLAAGIWGARGLACLLAQQGAARGRAAYRLAAGFGIISLVAWSVMLAAWPWGQLHPLTGPFLAARGIADSVPNVTVHFAGEWFAASSPPPSYLPGWFLRTLPETWFITALLAIGGVVTWKDRSRSPDSMDGLLVLGAAVLPLAAAVVMQPPVYDGLRHFLFVLPALAAALAGGASRALRLLPSAATRTAAGLLGAAWLLAGADLVALHPYEYVYFNRLVAGGVARGAAEYEGDYWSASVKEGVRWMLSEPGLRADRPLRVAVTGPPVLVSHWLEASGAQNRFLLVDPPDADLLLSTTRWFRHRAPGQVLHVVERMGAPLLYVIALQPVFQPGPRRLQAGDVTLDLPLPAGWFVEPGLSTVDQRPRFLARSARGGGLDLIVATPANGPVASDQALREELAAQLRLEPGGVGSGAVERLEGPSAEGWSVRWGGTSGGAGQQLLGALRTGPIAVYFRASQLEPGSLSALLAGLAASRQGPPPDRSP